MFKIVRQPSGKPELLQAGAPLVSVSLSHDARYCVGVAGSGAQGVDLEIITPRTQEEWHNLLASAYHPLLTRLAYTESISLAGTRIWSTLECLYKAFGVRAATLSVYRQTENALILRCELENGASCYMLTKPILFTLGKERMLAMVVELEEEGAQAIEPTVEAVGETHDAEASSELDNVARRLMLAGFDPTSYMMDGDEDRLHFILRWPLTFKAAANLDRSVYFTHYLEWMGTVRELAMQPIMQPFAAQMSTGQWGMVTNHSEVQILGEAQVGDVMEVHYWVRRTAHQPGSTVDLHFDWRRLDANGMRERVALGKLQTTWVALVGHGQVKAMPLPDYFQTFIDERTPPNVEQWQPEPLPEKFKEVDLGAVHYHRPHGPERGPTLAQRRFETCLQESNLVGNIYFSNYYAWQARLVDSYIQPLIPHVYRAMGVLGELRCIHTRVEHLIDAMPFEEIEVILSLEALYAGGVTFGFDYFRVQSNGVRQKLAFGEQTCVWLTKQAGASVPGPLPVAVVNALHQSINSDPKPGIIHATQE